jgi:hypothetical protein
MENTMDADGGASDAGGVLRASGADADGIEKRDGKGDDGRGHLGSTPATI